MAGRTLVFLAEPPHVTKYIQQILFYYKTHRGWQNPCLSGRTPSCNTIHTVDPFLLIWESWLAEPLSFWQNPLERWKTCSRTLCTNLGIMASRTIVNLAEPPLQFLGSAPAEPLSFW